MIFTEISSDELQKVQEKNNDRYYLQQAAVYSKMQNFNNLKTKILRHFLLQQVFLFLGY